MDMMKKLKKSDENKTEKKKIKREINKKSLKNGSYSSMMIVVFVAIIVVVNLIVGNLPSKYTQIDITSQKLYSIGDQTKEMLKDLDSDVTIYQVVQSGSEDETISNLLQKYADESDHITVETKDPVVNPSFVSQYTSEDLASNSLIVVCGDRSKIVNYSNMYETSINYNTYSYETTGFDGEGQITSAIGYVTSENLPILYTLEGHGEKDLDDTMTQNLEKANLEIKSLNLVTDEGTVPDDASCLLINSPSSDISSDEKDAILSYLEGGGKAIIFSDYTTESMENFDALLQNYGVQRADGIVFEGDSQHYAMQTPYYLVPTVNSTDATTDAASSGYYVLAPYAQGIQKLDDVRDTLTITDLLSTSDSAYSKTDLNSTTMEQEDSDIAGPFALGVSITEDVSDDKQTKIIYFSTSYLLDSSVDQLVSGGNNQLVMGTVNWLTDTGDESSTVSIASKSLTTSYLTLTDADASFWKICTMGVIPGVFLVAGFVIWLKRRKA